ncbi:hypothetical protein NliqN6_0034 [Naganishia liquefaciens]|uniref:Uncharacterized protein n=1 Tax=Naganishia liquefaciens TaxID=104408 RepID=A0A8H3TM79_9TREE|nr:hypothetical protein NliqN6_0034 [Naganishia liquefaciens]
MQPNTQRPVLPALRMPQQYSTLDMPAFTFPSTSSGTSTPSYSDNGLGGASLPHTPLPGTPLALEKYWPMMITPTPTHERPFTFDFPPTCIPRTDSSCTVSSAGSSGTVTAEHEPREARQGKRLASGWSVASEVEEDDGLEWDDREEGILLSFLDNPLHPLATPYPPGTLPPSSALDDITSQIIRFHSPPTPQGGNALALLDVKRTGMTSSVSVPSLSAAKRSSKHRRTHSASGIPWKHTWRATRRKLYEIARREALGYVREDRFKERVISSPTDDTPGVTEDDGPIDFPPALIDGLATPLPTQNGAPSTPRAPVAETPSGRILKRPGGGMAMQRHGSETFLEFPPSIGLDLEVEEPERTTGKALRLSSSLQRSTKASSEARPVRPSGMQRKSSLLHRGQSFTADDFNNCLSLSSDAAFVDQACETPSIVFDAQSSHAPLDTTTPQATETDQDLFGKSFGQHYSLVSPPSSIFGSDANDVSMDADTIPATPDHGLPAIMLTKTSPSPMVHMRTDSGSSELEPSVLGGPLSFSAPTSPKFQLGLVPTADQDLTPRPTHMGSARPGLVRARSSTAAHKSPSAFAQFMNHTPAPSTTITTTTTPAPLESPSRPTAKRQKLAFGLTLPMPGAKGTPLDSGLASPFDENGMF